MDIAKIKKYIPTPVWNLALKAYYGASDLFKGKGVAESFRDYCGYKLFFGKEMDIAKRLDPDGTFEKEMCNLIATELGRNQKPVFLDIGANIGLVTLSTAEKCPAATIHSFEPGDSQRSFLSKNVKENKLSGRVSVYKFTVGDKDGEAEFTSHHSDYGSNDGFFDTHRAGRSFSTKTVKVEVKKLDTWWKEKGMPTVNVMKIDTEGAELMVLRGAEELISKFKPVIFLEISLLNLKSYPYKQADILSFFAERHYSLHALNGELVKANNLDTILERGEVSFVAKSV